jgi:hypothetical protein
MHHRRTSAVPAHHGRTLGILVTGTDLSRDISGQFDTFPMSLKTTLHNRKTLPIFHGFRRGTGDLVFKELSRF